MWWWVVGVVGVVVTWLFLSIGRQKVTSSVGDGVIMYAAGANEQKSVGRGSLGLLRSWVF